MIPSSRSPQIHKDESPFDLERLRQRFPPWGQRFIPSGGGTHEDHHGKDMFGFTIFLLSESIIFISFFFAYIVLRLTATNWVPAGVSKPEASIFVVFNTVVLLSSSVVIQLAERELSRQNIKKFRWLWSITCLMGIYFLIGQGIEWSHLNFGLTTALMGTTFYILTGFHGLHILTGVILQIIMLTRSFIRGNYKTSRFGVNATTIFWHFVDVIWVILFSLLYLW